MGWNSAEIAAATTKPILAGYAQVADLDRAQWSYDGGSPSDISDFNDTDSTDTAYRAIRGVDGLPGIKTQADSLKAAWSYCLDFSSNPITFDAICLLNANQDEATTIDVQIADDEDFSSNLETIHTFSSIPAGRIAVMDIDHDGSNTRRYSGVEFIRLNYSQAGTILPYIGQIAFAKRVQMPYDPESGYDSGNKISSTAVFQSTDGTVFKNVNYKNRRRLKASWGLDQSDDIANILAWFKIDTKGGTLPFLWWEDPATNPNEFLFMTFATEEIEFTFPFLGPAERAFEIDAVEQGPFFLDED